MIVDIREEYPGELAARDPRELAAELAEGIAFAKSRTARSARYESPADFQTPALWDLHKRQAAIGRARIERVKADALRIVGEG